MTDIALKLREGTEAMRASLGMAARIAARLENAPCRSAAGTELLAFCKDFCSVFLRYDANYIKDAGAAADAAQDRADWQIATCKMFYDAAACLSGELGAAETAADWPEGLCGLRGGSASDYAELKALNRTLNSYEILLGRERLESFPAVLFPDISGRCNCKCKTCSFHGPQQILPEIALAMTPEEYGYIARLLPYAKNVGVFGSGEPFLSPVLKRLAADGARYGCLMDIATNGMLLELFDTVDFDRDNFRLVISIDSADPQTLHRLRPGSDYGRIVAGIEALKKRLPQLRLGFNTVVSRANLDGLCAIAELAARLGVNSVAFNHLLALPGSEFFAILALRPSDIPALREQQRLIKEKVRGVEITFGPEEASLHAEDGLKPDNAEMFARSDAARPCRCRITPSELVVAVRSARQGLGKYPAPAIPESIARTTKTTATSLAEETGRLRALIAALHREFEGMPEREIAVPYCFAPFLLTVTQSDGQARCCCLLVQNMACGTEAGPDEVWNGRAYRALRAAMFSGRYLPPQCLACQDPLRYVHSDALLRLCASLCIGKSELRLPSRFNPPDQVKQLL